PVLWLSFLRSTRFGSFLDQDPFPFFKEGFGLFVFYALALPGDDVLYGHPVVPANFWPFPNHGFHYMLSLALGLSSSPVLGGEFVTVGDFLLGGLQFLLGPAHAPCLLDLIAVLGRQFPFEKEGYDLLVHLIDHFAEQF